MDKNKNLKTDFENKKLELNSDDKKMKLNIKNKNLEKDFKSKKLESNYKNKKLEIDSKKNIKIILLVLMVLLIFINIYSIFFSEKKYINRFINAGFHVEYNTDSSSEFYVWNKNIFQLSKDGVKLLNQNADVIWEDIFSINYPVFITEDNFIFVVEDKGEKVYLYDDTGIIYKNEFDFPILSASINKSGYSSIIFKETEKDYIIKAFANDGTEIAMVPQTNKEIYPVSTDISEDNRILVFSTLDISEANPTSHLMFFYLNSIESSEKTNIKLISGSDEKNQIISIVRFMDNNNLITVSNNSIVGRKEGDKLNFNETFRIELKNRISKIRFSDGKYITYILGDEFLNESGEKKGNLKMISLAGKIISTFDTDLVCDYLYTDSENIIVGEESKFISYDKNGNAMWEYDSLFNTSQLFYFKDTKTVLEASVFEANILKYKRVRK